MCALQVLHLCTYESEGGRHPEGEEDDYAYMILYPQVQDFSLVPPNVRAEYEKAQRVRAIDSEFYALGLRGTLEALCIEHGLIGDGNLFGKLKQLATDKSLPGVFSDMADYLRQLGNFGAHISGLTVNPEDVVAANEFIEAIFEYLYVAPAKLNRVTSELACRKAKMTAAK
ncbi:DUF4145 domain-containing protein [Lentzea chajnantorensis]